MLICLACGADRPGANGHCPGCGSKIALINGFETFAPETAQAKSGFDPRRFGFLSAIQDKNFWFRGRNELLAWALNSCFPDARSLLEIGCGSGAVLDHLSRSCPQLQTLAGSDAHVEGLRFAAERLGKRAHIFQMDARRIPFRQEFDVIGCFDVIEHIQEDALVLAAIYRAVAPGGGVILTVPQHRLLWSRHDEVARHIRRYGARELTAVVAGAGFRIALLTSFVTLLLPVMLASRMLERIRPQPETEGLQVGGAPNQILYRIMRFERALIARGLRLPVGGSLLLVARRP